MAAKADKKLKVLVIDDDPNVSWMLNKGLSEMYDFKSARDGVEGLQMVTTEQPDLILLDIKMPGMTGLEVLEKLNRAERRPDVLMLSGHAETDMVVKSVQLGATEFIKKPFDVEEVGIHIGAAVERRRLKEEVRGLKEELLATKQYDSFIGEAPSMHKVRELIDQVADSELTVLIRGESGTGKEVAARMLHAKSGRAKKPFVKVNCAAIPRDLLEAELFGYEKGSFTGAHKQKQGRFEIANGGVIFLDEIGDMPHDLQSKLLQVLEQQEFVRVGGVQNIRVDVRIICATNKNLELAIENSGFRDDLFYRLNEITIFLPPLRSRREDIPILVEHFVDRYNRTYGKSLAPLSPAAMSKLISFAWPGNVRQLENLLKQIVVRGDESVIDEHLSGRGGQTNGAPMPSNPARGNGSQASFGGVDGIENGSTPFNPEVDGYSLKKRLELVIAFEEKKLIKEALTKTNWNRRRASEILDISYRSLLYKIKEYALNDSE